MMPSYATWCQCLGCPACRQFRNPATGKCNNDNVLSAFKKQWWPFLAWCQYCAGVHLPDDWCRRWGYKKWCEAEQCLVSFEEFLASQRGQGCTTSSGCAAVIAGAAASAAGWETSSGCAASSGNHAFPGQQGVAVGNQQSNRGPAWTENVPPMSKGTRSSTTASSSTATGRSTMGPATRVHATRAPAGGFVGPRQLRPYC